jgi:hypothetical protein
MRKTFDQAGPDRIDDEGHDDGNGRRGPHGHLRADRAIQNDHIDSALYQVGDQLRHSIVIAFG